MSRTVGLLKTRNSIGERLLCGLQPQNSTGALDGSYGPSPPVFVRLLSDAALAPMAAESPEWPSSCKSEGTIGYRVGLYSNFTELAGR